jgi:quinol monooxygenase YgiN
MHEGDIKDLAKSGNLVVIASWDVKPEFADEIADILAEFIVKARSEPGVNIFLIARKRNDPAAFVFYEVFADEKAFAAHQQTEWFKSLIQGRALPKLIRRERSEFTLL